MSMLTSALRRPLHSTGTDLPCFVFVHSVIWNSSLESPVRRNAFGSVSVGTSWRSGDEGPATLRLLETRIECRRCSRRSSALLLSNSFDNVSRDIAPSSPKIEFECELSLGGGPRIVSRRLVPIQTDAFSLLFYRRINRVPVELDEFKAFPNE